MKLNELLLQLGDKTGAKINIEPLHKAFFDDDNIKLAPNQYLHYGDYCVYAKNAGGISVCSDNKRFTNEKAAAGNAFEHCCPYGIWDLVQPVIFEQELAAVIYLGYFKTAKEPSVVKNQVYRVKPLTEITVEIKELLLIHADFLAKFIVLELEKWQKKYGNRGRQNHEQFYVENCRKFIEKKYPSDISLNEYAEIMGLNSNYLGALIKRVTGKTFRQLLNERRVKEAKIYLRFHRHISISETGYTCGFNDSNYFSTVFSRFCGCSPGKYRKKYNY